MATIFVSPGVFTREQDFTIFASRIGITRLGVVGKTLKGPAFEPIKIRTTDDFLLRFGSTDPDYPLPYVANSFLAQSNELTVTRILGNNGFTNSPAWLIIADIATTYSGETAGTNGLSGLTFTIINQTAISSWVFSTSANTAMANDSISAFTSGNDVYVNFSGDNISTSTWLDTINGTAFSGFGITVEGESTTDYITSAGTSTWTLTSGDVEPKGEKSGSTLAVLRSKRNQVTNNFYFENESDVTIANITTTLGSFMLSATTGPLTAQTNSGITISLDETREDYIVKILGKSPEVIDGALNLYVERIYPHFVREADARYDIAGINPSLVFTEETSYTDFGNGYTNAITPWVVSRVIGGDVKNLFRVQTISDGDSSNVELKISIANIDINNYTFDIIVRRFEDTDATASSTALERWSNLSLREEDSNFIAKVIGTTDEEYPRKSNFITIDLAPSFPRNTVPAGFRGYSLRESGISGSTAANLYYKTGYLSADTVFKTYLGISELGYGNFTTTQVSTRNAIKNLEADLFAYEGGESTDRVTVKGFHLENTANSSEFVSGSIDSLTGYTNDAATLVDRNKLKFTLVPAGGFDGWDKYQTYAELYDEFTDAYTNNVNAFKEGLDEIANPEVVDINVLATPGVDFSNNSTVVRYALDIVEERTDSIYVIDAPRLTSGSVKGTPEEVVSRLEATGIDSNYAATYWPWIQIEDPNSGKYTYQAPTMMAVQTFALTDNTAAPWFAPAGLNRGLAGPQVIRADVRLNNNQRDTLYQGRVNPIATFVQQGVVIWGQKTLQVRQSALDRINIRRLLLQVRRLVSAASLTLVFEQNDQTLRDQFLARVEPILLQIQNQRGLTAFKVVMDDSNNTPDTIDRNTLVGKIQLQPTRTAEFIDLTFQVLPTGARFEDF
ncbi:MAG: phage tail sheath C-terminal domain-containing protein [Nanoarchaeota archaeon]|mgnify:CR=1 FL=1